MSRLHIVALACDPLTKIRYSCVKILVILFWLVLDNIDCCLQLSILGFFEKVADFSAIINVTVAMISKALYFSLQKSLMDKEEHSLTFLCTLLLLHIYISMHVCEDLQENMI